MTPTSALADAGGIPATVRCACGAELAPSLLSCPACHALVHRARLEALAVEAAGAEARSDVTGQLEAWRAALELLPADSRQHAGILEKVEGLSRRLDADGTGTRGAGGSWKLGAVAGGALLAWKFKAVVLFVLGKGKLLVLGLTKGSTAFSMLASLGVYWAQWGWAFAAGLVASIYVHEMGHVAAMRRLGLPASAPMFVPGLGAFVRLRQAPSSAREDARIGLAGPIWGVGAALACYAVYLGGGGDFWAAMARVGAWINLFNLLPVWQLDGGRAFHAMSLAQRITAAAALGVFFLLTGEGLLVLLALAAAVQAFRAPPRLDGDSPATMQYVLLAGALSLMCRIDVRMG